MVDRHVPRFVNVRKRRPDWITQETVRQLRKKKRLSMVYKRQGDTKSARKYKAQEKAVTKMVRNAKRRMERRLANNKDDMNGRKFMR
jgi:Na+/phosphate symporter